MRYRDDEKQQRIKKAVMELSLSEGFSGTSISKIARKAGVSPATVYIYYENKDAMLRDIYLEYSESVFGYLHRNVTQCEDAGEMIASLMESYYDYIRGHEEVFSFVEQFVRCPGLACSCSRKEGMCELNGWLDTMKEEGKIVPASDESIMYLMFSPIKAIASQTHSSYEEQKEQLAEIIALIRKALLR